MVVHRGARGNEREVEFALESLLDDLHVEKPEEAHAEAKAQGHGGLGLPGEGRVVDVELVQGVAEVLVVLVVHGEEAREDHGLGLAVARQGLCRGALGQGEGVTHAHRVGVLEARDHVADLAHAQLVDGLLGGALDAHAVDQEVDAGLHHEQRLALADGAVKDAHRGDDASVLVKVGVQDEGLERRVRVTLGGRDQEDDGLQEVVDALARLAGDAHGVVCRDGKVLLDLLLDLVGVGARKVDLVDGRDDVQVGIHGQVGIGDRLGLHALGGVHDKDRALARGQGPRDLVGEVDVSRGVDEVELVGLAVIGVIHHPHGIRLDRDAALALDVHGVQELGLHVPLLHRMGEFEDAVRDGRLAVVDVRNDREVADM